MSDAEPREQLAQAILLNSPWEEAAALLEQAARVGKATPELNYLLALCYKRDGKRAEARAALRKITPPDANVLLQLGLLSFADRQFAQAAEEFARALELDPHLFAAAYNLLLCRLNLGQIDECVGALPQAIRLAPDAGQKRFLRILEQLLRSPSHAAAPETPAVGTDGQNGDQGSPLDLRQLSGEDEERLLGLLRSVEQADAIYPVLQAYAAGRPDSAAAQRICLELALAQAKRHAERYHWSQVDGVLTPLARLVDGLPVGRDPELERIRVTFLNLQGVSAFMLQDFDRAIRLFSAALKTASNKAWLHQNLALAYEAKGRLDQAETHWNRYFDLLDARTPVPDIPNYLEALAFAGLCRLGEVFSKHDRLGSAVNFLQRAHRLRSRDVEVLEKLFQMYQQARRPEDARRILQRLRDIRPADPQFDLYELDLIDIRSLDDVDRILNEIRHILQRHPGDGRVDERATHAIVNLLPMIHRHGDQLTEKLAHIADQVRRLPNYQINWPVVHDEMRALRLEFQRLRKACNKCQALIIHDDQKRALRDLVAQIDGKINTCISMGG